MAVVLVAENNAHQRLLYARELVDEGHEVLVAEDGKEALGILREKRADIAVLDLHICNATVPGPGLDGLDLSGHLLNMDDLPPVIIHTAYPCYQDDFASSRLAVDYVEKSSDLAPLKTAITRVIEQRALQVGSEARPEIESRHRRTGLVRAIDGDWLQATPSTMDEPASMTSLL